MESSKIVRSLVAAVVAAGVAASAVATAVPAAAAPSNRTTVDGWYVDLLGRSADADSRYWVDRLDAGVDPAQLAWDLAHTREAATREVTRYYRDYLGRDLDPGAAYWVDGAVAGRFPLEWVAQNVLASDEFYARHYQASTTVRYWYEHVLGVPAFRSGTTDAEISYWVGRWNRIGRLGALREMWYAPDSVRWRLGQNYLQLLRRGVDDDGVAYWTPREVASDDRVRAQLAGTAEYATAVLTPRPAP